MVLDKEETYFSEPVNSDHFDAMGIGLIYPVMPDLMTEVTGDSLAGAALWGGVALAAIYAWFSGWGVPAQRTCLMLLCVAVLRTRGLAWPWWSVLAAAAAAVLLLDPWALLQPGFWLSFVAVGVLFATAAPVHAQRQASASYAAKLQQNVADF